MALITGSTDKADFADCDMVIEAVFEDMDLKKSVFAELDQICKPGAVMASNTSYLDIDEIASATTRPESVIGMHFFSPANVMKLLEVVRADATSPEALKTMMQLGKRIGKVPVAVGVCHGFVGNRMLKGYARQAQLLLLEGATPEQVDNTMQAWGMAMGPHAMSDMAGQDVGAKVRQERGDKPSDPRYFRIADLIVESLRACVMLAEPVAGKQDALLLQVGEHAVGPVQHTCLEKRQGTAAETEFFAVLDRLIVPVREEMLLQVAGAHLGAIQRLVLANPVHDPGQPPRVVHLRVIADHQIDLFGIDNSGDIVQHLVREFFFDRIDQGHLLIHDQKRVVGRSLVGAVAMKVPDVPVFHSDIVNTFGNFNRLHGCPLSVSH